MHLKEDINRNKLPIYILILGYTRITTSAALNQIKKIFFFLVEVVLFIKKTLFKQSKLLLKGFKNIKKINLSAKPYKSVNLK